MRPTKKTIALAASLLALVGSFVTIREGYSSKPYRDIGGVLTVCWGHTDLSGGSDPIVPGKWYSKSECTDFLNQDIENADRAIRQCLPPMPSERTHAALLSAVFNLGPRVVCGSTLQRDARAGNWKKACNDPNAWNTVKGRVVRGLVIRRGDEAKMCLEGLPDIQAPYALKSDASMVQSQFESSVSSSGHGK